MEENPWNKNIINKTYKYQETWESEYFWLNSVWGINSESYSYINVNISEPIDATTLDWDCLAGKKVIQNSNYL